ncbi:MAG: DNRLRE domain-containing protein [Acidobacteria bacterium]|nr:DNRLRE domain-containing protein [Acidobacteriota bacterium]
MTKNSLHATCVLRSLLLMVAAMFLPPDLYAQTGFVREDAFTQASTPNQNFGPNSNLRVGVGINSYLKFDFSALPPATSGSDVTKATLRLWVNTATTAGSFDVRRVIGTWDEETITANSAPSLGSADVSGIQITTQDENSFVTIDITTLVKDWLNGLLANNGIALLANAANTNIRFDSKENGQTSHEPRLEIVLKGPKGLNWKGAWNAATNYFTDDAVSLNGSSWVAKQANTNVTPIEGAVWTIIAQKGETGATGATGSQGPQGPMGPQGPAGPPGVAEELILIHEDLFDEGYLDVADWESSTNAGSCISFSSNALLLSTTDCSNVNIGEGIATVRGTRQFSVNDGTLIFKSRMLDVYVEPYHPNVGAGTVYGNAQPRGLVNGSNRNNAIEFISAGASLVVCRTVKDGAITQTEVDIGQNLRVAHTYQIIAKPDVVKFYVNGALKCMHTTNIPVAPLNIFFSTSDSSAGNVPMFVDFVSFERRP